MIVAGVVNDVLFSDESSLLARRTFTFPVKMTGIKVRSFPFLITQKRRLIELYALIGSYLQNGMDSI